MESATQCERGRLAAEQIAGCQVPAINFNATVAQGAAPSGYPTKAVSSPRGIVASSSTNTPASGSTMPSSAVGTLSSPRGSQGGNYTVTIVTSPTQQSGASTSQFPWKIVIQGKPFLLEGMLGSGSFGTVYRGRERGTFGNQREVAVKEIRCTTEKEVQQAEYEAELMGLVSPDALEQRVACPRLFAVETSAKSTPKQWTVMLAMEKVEGEPLDDFARKPAHKRGYLEAVSLGRELLEQMCPALIRVSAFCLHRDINAHNIMLAAQTDRNVFTLIDFGLARDAPHWQSGGWKGGDVGGDCRYWLVSSWKQILFGYKYTAADPEAAIEYIYNLDIHSLALTCVQLTVEVTTGDVPFYAQPLYQAWTTYWEDATRFFTQLMAFIRGHTDGDFNKLKNAFLQQQIMETYARNIQNLRRALVVCAANCSPAHGAFFTAVAEMLAGRHLEWTEIQSMLMAAQSYQTVNLPVKVGQRREHSTDSKPAFTKDVPDISIERRVGENRVPMQRNRKKEDMVCGLNFGLGMQDGETPHGAGRRSHSEDKSGIGRTANQLKPPSIATLSLRKITEENLGKTPKAKTPMGSKGSPNFMI